MVKVGENVLPKYSEWLWVYVCITIKFGNMQWVVSEFSSPS